MGRKKKESYFDRPCIFIIIGGPGSGKETQGKKMNEFLSKDNRKLRCIDHDNGTKLREATKNKSNTVHMRRLIKESMNGKGETVPGALTASMWANTFLKANNEKTHIIFEGILRTRGEVDQFAELAEYCMPRSSIYLICLDVSDKVLKKRLVGRKKKGASKRGDDNNRAIIKRIKTYRDKTYPIALSLRNDHRFTYVEVDGELPEDEVCESAIFQITVPF